MEITEARALLDSRGVKGGEITKTTGSFGKEIFLVDDSLVLRVSAAPPDGELAKFDRVRDLPGVPRALDSGSWKSGTRAGAATLYWVLVSLVPGEELFDTLDALDRDARERVALGMSGFLDRLHGIRGETYDIGHYVPVIGSFPGSWKAGHLAYRDWLLKELGGLSLDAPGRGIVARCGDWIDAHADCLEYEGGPCLLHNDFHPKNVIVREGAFSGVIDWECSQWGERDFELVHFVHWALAPVGTEMKAGPELPLHRIAAALLAAQFRSSPVPRAAERLRTYLLEHDLFQIVLSKGARKDIYYPRLARWLDGESDRFLADWGVLPDSNGGMQ